MKPECRRIARALVAFGCCALAYHDARAGAADRANDTGLAILDYPDGSRAHIRGAVASFARSAGGTLFIGSNGIATYDGSRWRKIEVPGSSEILTLNPAVDSPATIWVGTNNSIGWLERSADGQWRYRSLHEPLVAAGIGQINDVRLAHPIPGGAVFVARNVVMRWDGTAITRWDMPAPIRIYAFADGDKLFLYQNGVGLHRMTADGPELTMPESEIPVTPPLVALFAMSEGVEIAVSHFDLIRRVNGGPWQRLREASALLEPKRAMRAVRFKEHLVAIATAYGGIVFANSDGSIHSVINNQTGLPDDNVHALWSNGTDQFLIGMSAGLARLTGVESASIFDPRTRIFPRGIRRVLPLNGRPHVITSQNVYELNASTNFEPARFERKDNFWPFLADGARFDGALWLGGVGGLWRIEGDRAENRVRTATPVTGLAAIGADGGKILFFEGRSAKLLAGAGSEWAARDAGIELDGTPLSVLRESPERVWASTAGGGVHALDWDDRAAALTEGTHLLPGRGLPEDVGDLRLATLGGRVFALAGNGVLELDESGREFRWSDAFRDFVALAATDTEGDEAYWIVTHKLLGRSGPSALLRVTIDDGIDGVRLTPIVAPGLDQLGGIASASLTHESGEPVLWIGGSNALLRLVARSLPEADPVPETRLSGLVLDEDDTSRYLPVVSHHFSPSVRRLEFEFGAGVAHSNDDGFLFMTRLVGVENEWSLPHVAAQREFTGLPHGSYVFQARAMDRFGRMGEPLQFAFTLRAPWYATRWAMAAWAAVLVLLIAAVMRLRLRRLKRQTERLNELVNERTRELSLSNTARSEFLDGLSHEIRRPINGIVSLTRKFEEEGLAPAQREHVRLLRLGGESLMRVFNDVLNFSKMESGAVAVEERPFSLRHLLGAAMAECGVAGAQPEVLLPEGVADAFLGDESKLMTIVSNFLVNTQKYAPEAPVEVTAVCSSAGDNACEVLIEVADGGPGVPAEEQELIFKRFVRGSIAKRSRIPGTGIGLATCRLTARLIGGSVGVESPSEHAQQRGWPGPGTTFFLKVRLRRNPHLVTPAAEVPQESVQSPSQSHSG